jgi:hypothetical protein
MPNVAGGEALNTLINKRAVKSFAMKVASERHHRFSRIGQGFLDTAEGFLRQFIRDHVHRLPSKGRTIK